MITIFDMTTGAIVQSRTATVKQPSAPAPQPDRHQPRTQPEPVTASPDQRQERAHSDARHHARALLAKLDQQD